MDLDKMRELIAFGREQGLSQITVDGVTIHIPQVISVIEPTPQTEEELKKIFSSSPYDDLSDEEVLFWHTPYFDEIQEKKRLKQEAIANEIRDEVPHGEDSRT